jgi:hypothetical protein
MLCFGLVGTDSFALSNYMFVAIFSLSQQRENVIFVKVWVVSDKVGMDGLLCESHGSTISAQEKE